MRSRLPATALSQAEDPVVIALACAGDELAFAELVRRRQQRVRKFMYHLCRQPSLGDDRAQQVFVRMWRSLNQLRTAAAFDGWLKRIMVTIWLEEARRHKLQYLSELGPDLEGAQREDIGEQLDLDAALAKLPSAMRLCVVLAYNEGMSHPEIAELTNMPVGTVKCYISRGAARLREMLATYAGS